MMLENRNAVIHGGSGAIGSAVARAMAREGAHVVLVARTPSRLHAVARQIADAGGSVETAWLDALDEQAVEGHVEALAARLGHIDIALNAVGIAHVQGTPLAQLSFDEYALPLHAYTRTNFLTARAVARQMVKQRSGVIMTLSTPGSRMAGAGFMGYGAACAAVEAMTRHLAGELGGHGVRVLCLRPDAIPEAQQHGTHAREVFRQVAAHAGLGIDAMLAERGRAATLLKRLPTLDEVAETAAFMASDRAGAITASVVNLSCGAMTEG